MNRYKFSMFLSLLLLVTTFSCKEDSGTKKSELKSGFINKDWKIIPFPRIHSEFPQSLSFQGKNIQIMNKSGETIISGSYSVQGDSIFIDGGSYARYFQETSDRLTLAFKEPLQTNNEQLIFELNFYNLEESIVSVDEVELENMIQNSGWYFSEGMNKFPFSVSKAIDPNRESFSFVQKGDVMYLNLKSPGNGELEFPISVLRSTDMTVLGFPVPGVSNVLLRDDAFQN